MASDWQSVAVGAISRTVTKGTTPTTSGGRFVEEGVNFIKVESITKDGRFATEKFAHIDPDTHHLLARSQLEEDDILFTIAGTIGRVARVTKGELPANINQAIAIIRPDRDKVDPRFLCYALRDDLRSAHAHARVVQSVQANFSLAELKLVEVPLPPLAEQRGIAHILGTLDDKIELNRRMNETLEEMARGLFKSWFVDFDPVRAKAEGRDPGLPPYLADLFPDRLVESELGQIPEGWEIETLGVHFEAVRGVSYSGSGLDEAGVPLHNLNSVFEGGGYKHAGIKYYSGEWAERHRVRPGDVIVANTEQGHERLLIGHAAIVPSAFGDLGIASHHIYVMRPKPASALTREFLCDLLNSREMHGTVSRYANGTTVNMLPVDGLQMPRFASPPVGVCAVFTDLRGRFTERQENVGLESSALIALRDALLPRLISGEISSSALRRREAASTPSGS